jgi:protocatechuate 3,4-dioxygenase beta subunit
MRLPAFLIFSVGLLFYGAAFCPSASSQTVTTKRNADATVSGKVTIKGKPAPGVLVGLRLNRATEDDPTFKATTDQEGNYRIADLPAGSYWIAPVAPAFVTQGIEGMNARRLIVSESEHVQGIDFELVRGGVITGKVTDEEGHPLVEERVSLLSVGERGRGTHTARTSATDDRGIYRMFGIQPGRYKVLIGMDGNFYSGRGRATRRPTFYPDATDAAKATTIEVGEGAEVTKIDFILGPAPQGYAVSGRVLDESGKPVPNAPIALSRLTILDANSISGYGVNTGTRSDKQGEFRIEDLSPGKYSVTVSSLPESDMRPETTNFDLLDSDVTGLVIKTSKGGSVAGILVLEGANANELMANLSEPFMEVNTIHQDKSTTGRSVPIGPGGAFRIGGLEAGTVRLIIDSPTGVSVLRIERDGVSLPNAIPLRNGEHIDGIRVILVRRNGSVRGTIKVENGVFPVNGRFIVQLVKTENQDNVGSADVDSRGHFLVEGLAGGDYELSVFAFVPGSSQRLPTTKQLVSVTDGAVTEVTVIFDLTAKPIR